MTETFIPAAVPGNEEERLAELRHYNILDTRPETSFDLVARIAMYIFRTPIALVSLVDEARQWFKSKQGVDATETPRRAAFCAHAILNDDVFVVPDALNDARFAGNPLVVGPPHVRFYAGAPLKTPNGLNIGTLCVIDTKPRDMSAEEQTILLGLAKLVVDELELRLKIAQLGDETYQRQNAEQSAREAFSRLERAQYNFISEHVARELSSMSVTSPLRPCTLP